MALKGQGSAEYLIILAAVLIVALVAIMLIGGFPSFGGDAKMSESQQYWRASARPFIVPEHSQVGTTLYIVLQNVESDRLIVTGINVSNGTSNIPAVGVTMGGGARKTFQISGLMRCNETAFDEYEYNIQITYNSSDIGSKSEYGSKPIIGRCVVG